MQLDYRTQNFKKKNINKRVMQRVYVQFCLCMFEHINRMQSIGAKSIEVTERKIDLRIYKIMTAG